LAIDFFAFVRTGFWPVITVTSSTIASRTLGCLIASPMPTLMVILVRFGIWCGFFSPNCFMSRSRTVFT